MQSSSTKFLLPTELERQQVGREVGVKHGDLSKVSLHLVEHLLLLWSERAYVTGSFVLGTLLGRR